VSTRNASATIIFAVALLVTRVERACAHGDLHGQIESVSAQIEKDPQNADLYLRRGELHRLHSEFPKAAADFDKAAALHPDWPQAEIAKSRLALTTGEFEVAAAGMDRLLPKHPEYPEGWLIRARARTRLGDYAGAAKDYSEIVERVDRPEPDVFLERAAALTASGGDQVDNALRGLEEGLTKLGPVITLDLAALDLELKLKRTEEALRRIDRLAAGSRRQETWLSRRGEILAQAGRTDEARAAFGKALEAIAALPKHIQATQATTELRQRITASIVKLDGKAE
jgi:tetratricopeptide (TPR) repeat protein